MIAFTMISRAVTVFALFAIAVMLAISQIKGSTGRKKPLKCTFKYEQARGVVFGKKGPVYYYSPSSAEGHVFVGGGSGTGKTSALLIPTLRSWEGNSFVIDISGDISKNVNMDRKIIYDPLSPGSSPYNIFAPIDELYDDSDKVEALAQLALLIMPRLQNSSANADYY